MTLIEARVPLTTGEVKAYGEGYSNRWRATAMAVADTPAIEITYIGGPTALIEIAGVTFITDPTFDAPGKDYRSGTVTLRKLAGPAIDAARLGRVDVALVSH